jgi:hypothetical protein
MQDKQQKQQNPSQPANPERLAVSDEAQRTKEQEQKKEQQVPTGNERGEKTDTEGAQAGMGE